MTKQKEHDPQEHDPRIPLQNMIRWVEEGKVYLDPTGMMTVGKATNKPYSSPLSTLSPEYRRFVTELKILNETK